MFQSSPGWLQRWWTLTTRWRVTVAPSSLNRASLSWGWSGHIQGSCWSPWQPLRSPTWPQSPPSHLGRAEISAPWSLHESMAAVASVSAELPINFSLSWNQEFEVNSLLNWQGGQQTWSRCEEWGEKWEKESRSQNQKWKCKKIHFCPGTWGNRATTWRAEK